MRLRHTFLGFIFLGATCTFGCSAEPSPPDPEPVVNSAPYLCIFVPERALRLSLNASGLLPESKSGTMEDGQCTVPQDHPYLLAVSWAQERDKKDQGDSYYLTREHLAELLESNKRVYTRYGGAKFPPDLGDGMAAKIPSGIPNLPYEMVAKFLCSGKERYLTFSFAEFAKGRDPFKDMTELMRIAQKRYAALYKCKLGQ